MSAEIKWPVIGIFLILLVQALLWFADFLIPITAAVLGYITVSPIRRRLSRRGVPNVVTATCITLGVLAISGYGAVKFAEPLTGLVADLPELVEEFADGLSGGGETLKKINEAVDAAEEAMESGDDDTTMEVKVVEETNYVTSLIKSAPAVLGQAVFAMILLLFLVSSGDLFVLKIVQGASSFNDKRKAVKLVQSLERKLGHYLGSITLINIGLGVVIGIAMALWGLSTPVLFGLIAFAFNFIPFLGAVAGASFTALVAFSEFKDLWPTLGVFMTYMILTSAEAQLVTPKILSNRLKLNTPFVFIAVAFFAWIWSVIGMIVAVPILIVAKIVLDEFDSTKKIGAFLGDL